MTTFTPPARVPAALRALKNWVVWRLVYKEGGAKPSKVPFYANGTPRLQPGTDDDRRQLVTFDDACAAAARGAYSGLGFATLLDAGVVALDFDDCVVGGQVDPAVLAVCEGTYTEFSPSGNGVRAFMLGQVRSRKDTKGKGGAFPVEVFGDTGFVTVTGHMLDVCDLFGWTEAVPMTPAALDLYRQRWGDPSAVPALTGDYNDNALLALEPKQGWTLEQARAVLFMCDPNAGRDDWLKALMGLHHEFDGSQEAFDLANEWSAQGANYAGTRDVEGRWRSFGRNSGSRPTTAAWLKRWAAECETRRRYTVAADWKRQVQEAKDEFTLRETLCPKIQRDSRLGELERESLAQALVDAFKALGTKYPIAQCRKLIAENRVEKRREKSYGDDDLPEWARGWVWVTDDDKFYRMDTDEWLTMQSFNAKYNREIQGQDDEFHKTASWVALEDLQLPTVTRGKYAPMRVPGRAINGKVIDSLVFEEDGVLFVNTFRPSSVPPTADVIDADGRQAIEVVLRHVRLVAGGRQRIVDILLSWIAFNVQWTGLKIRWAPLIKGIEGDGKSFFGLLMGALIGRPNVRNVSPTVLGTDFTGWAEGACVAVLEEIKLTGHNRYDILNALKPYITNTSVEIHRKGRDPYNAENTQNYIAFTNHSDALPLSDTDRRWLVLHTPYSTQEEFERIVREMSGLDNDAYFSELFSTLETHAAALRRWFMDYVICDEFKANGHAPQTEEKQMMIALSKSAEESMIEEIVEIGALGVTKTVLASSCLSDAMQSFGSEITLATTALNRALTKSGWSKIPKRVKWNGRAHWIWTRGTVPSWNQSLKAELDKTLSLAGSGSRLAVDLFDSEPHSEPA